MLTRIVALVVLVLGIALSAPARAADAPLLPIATSPEVTEPMLTELKLARRDLGLTAFALSTGIALTVTGPIAFFGAFVAAFNGTRGAGMLFAYSLVATPVGVVTTVASGIRLGFAQHRVDVLQAEVGRGTQLRVSVAPGMVGKSTGLTIAATW